MMVLRIVQVADPLVDLNFSVHYVKLRLRFYGKSKLTAISMVYIALWMLWMHCAYSLHPMMKTLCIP